MAIRNLQTALNANEVDVLHRSVGKRFSVQITEIGEPEVEITDRVLMRRTRNAIPGDFFPVDFIGLSAGQCIPFGAVAAKAQPGSPPNLIVKYTLRTGSDA